ncbi:hypothetical protein FGIG_03421 [Fasciola gigantica]|uniref:EF-hand domain-containing protein n=1 Tax=Fasciola gigantica TaxID=46835 RepID=A0A504Y5Z5_FASGI|nr:hypothetical protein FGIG_03421 [Fasciola gigantica]
MLRQNQIVELLKKLDTNEDGMISIQELRDFMANHCAVFDKADQRSSIISHSTPRKISVARLTEEFNNLISLWKQCRA